MSMLLVSVISVQVLNLISYIRGRIIFGWLKQFPQAFQDVTAALKPLNVTRISNVFPTVSPSQDSVLLAQSKSDEAFSSAESDQDDEDLFIFHKWKLHSSMKSINSAIESDEGIAGNPSG